MGLHIGTFHPSQQSYEASIRAALERKDGDLQEIMLVYVSGISRQEPSESQPSKMPSTPFLNPRVRGGSEYVILFARYLILFEEDNRVEMRCIKCAEIVEE